MKVISGYLANRVIDAPKAQNFRPSTQRLKEAVFSSLCSKINLGSKKVLDLYSGSGAVGIEAISRGASCCDFVEKNPKLTKSLELNLKKLEINANSNVYNKEVLDFINSAKSSYDIIFADPPYGLIDVNQMFLVIAKLLNQDGVFIFEERKDGAALSLEVNLIFNKIYGDTKISMIRI